MADYRLMEEKKIVKRFISEVYSGKGLGIYGIYDVIKSLKNGFADLVIVNDDITIVRVEIKCNKCQNIQEKFIERNELMSLKQEFTSSTCPSCGSQDLELSDQDIIEYLEELSLMSGSRLEVISGKTEEGAQLASLGKIGAILRFKQNNQ
jgi:peptide chain release factor subunit 1